MNTKAIERMHAMRRTMRSGFFLTNVENRLIKNPLRNDFQRHEVYLLYPFGFHEKTAIEGDLAEILDVKA
ncbi:MAG: hypothetical protein RR723_06210 [Raoultibacter sp.]